MIGEERIYLPGVWRPRRKMEGVTKPPKVYKVIKTMSKACRDQQVPINWRVPQPDVCLSLKGVSKITNVS